MSPKKFGCLLEVHLCPCRNEIGNFGVTNKSPPHFETPLGFIVVKTTWTQLFRPSGFSFGPKETGVVYDTIW